jgi:SAM-dependent methyltransferase
VGHEERAALQQRVLESLESARNYNSWIASLALPFLGANPIEIGSGTGINAEHWLAAGVRQITVSDIGETALAALRARFDGDPRVEIAQIDILQPSERGHSAVVAVNVLEHIDDDVEALRAAQTLIAPDGHVIVFVPAFGFAMSRFDRDIGHARRYTRRSLAESFRRADLEILKLHYVNAPGLVAWLFAMRLLGLTPHDGRALHVWDRFVVPLTRSIESRVAPPFGQSAFGVGRAR